MDRVNHQALMHPVPHYHNTQAFDYDSFFYSAFGYMINAVQGDNLYFTTVFINKDDNGELYASYRFSKDFIDELVNNPERKVKPKIYDIIEELERQKIYLDKNSEKDFDIIKLEKDFERLSFEDTPLNKAKPLNGYLKNIPDLKKLKGERKADTFNIKYFKALEKQMIIEISSGLNNVHYQPLPIISRGEIVGALYFIFDRKMLKKEHSIKALKGYLPLFILNITREYERVQLFSNLNSYGPKPVDPLAGYREIFRELGLEKARLGKTGSKESKKKIKGNKFLEDLGYDDYYRNFWKVLKKEAEEVKAAQKDRLKTAIISVIVDSFAHNVGAHSLVALKWWLENRYKVLDKSFKLELTRSGGIEHETSLTYRTVLKYEELKVMAEQENFYSDMSRSDSASSSNKISLLDIIRHMNLEKQATWMQFIDRDNPETQATLPVSIDYALYPFFEFLRNKSAFWSGVTRDFTFSGRLRTWFNLFRDYLSNTLFLGSVANSERINKINFFIEILEDYKEILSHKNPVPVNEIKIFGEFAQVNVEVLAKVQEEIINKDENRNISDYAFLRKGADYDRLKPAIKKLEDEGLVFFPSEMIGQQAFFTLLENTLRNIKHYHRQIEDIRKHGINLVISIQRVGFIKRNEKGVQTEDNKLYKIGTWLHHPQFLMNPKGKSKEDVSSKTVICAHTEQLKQRLLDSNGKVRLGGSSQDKVCAAMLMNNTFESIDAYDTREAKMHYFPYVFPASEALSGSDLFRSGKADYHKITQESIKLRKQPSFKVKDDILHMAYNYKLRGKESNERKAKFKKEQKRYTKRVERDYPCIDPYSDSGTDDKDLKPMGFVKKYFHLWIGRDCQVVTKDFNEENDNLARFRIVVVKDFRYNGEKVDFTYEGDFFSDQNKGKVFALPELRQKGIVRVIEANDHILGTEDGDIRYRRAMSKWMSEWLPLHMRKLNDEKESSEEMDALGVYLTQPDGDNSEKVVGVAQLVHKRGIWDYQYLNREEWVSHLHKQFRADDASITTICKTEQMKLSKDPHFIKFKLAHSENSSVEENDHTVRIRSHTAMLEKIFRRAEQNIGEDLHNNIGRASSDKVKVEKLIETAHTHITIFDNRTFSRIKKFQERFDAIRKKTPLDELPGNLYMDTLRIELYPEDARIFNDEFRKSILKKTHFLIIHLSFLESIWKNREDKVSYTEDEVQDFFDEWIKEFYVRNFQSPFPKNFMLVITSGRGRGSWITPKRHPQITFRPIEALLNAIEDGLNYKDDYQIKHNLCNLLYGS